MAASLMAAACAREPSAIQMAWESASFIDLYRLSRVGQRRNLGNIHSEERRMRSSGRGDMD
jgi:hypothetical protein